MTTGSILRLLSRRHGLSLVALVCSSTAMARAETPAPAKTAATEKAPAAPAKPAEAAPGGGDGAVYPPAGVSMGGAVGINRITSAFAGRAGSVRFGLRGGLFQANKFPTAGTNRQLYGELSGAYTLRPGMELFASLRNSSNSNSATSPSIVQSMGDFLIGGKFGGAVAGNSQLAGDVRFEGKSGTGKDYVNFRNSTVQIRALSSTAFKVGTDTLELHANAGGILGRSQDAMDERMTPEKLFGSGYSAYHRVVGGVGLQYNMGFFNPFVSFDLDIPLGVSGTNLKAANTSTFGAGTKRGALGARFQISPSLGAVDVAAELATGKGVAGFARTQPWMVFAAYSVAFDSSLYAPPPPAPLAPPPAAVETTGELRGTVIDQATKLPVKGAVVSVGGSTPVATGPDGVFVARDLKPGPVNVLVEREGYKPVTGSAKVTAGGEEKTQLSIEALPPPPPPTPITPFAPPPPPPMGFLAGQIRAGHAGVPGTVRVLNTTPTREYRTSRDGSFSIKLPPGRYELLMLADGYFARSAAATVYDDSAAAVLVTTAMRPAVANVRQEGDKLVLTQPFTLDETKVELSAAELFSVAEIADILARDASKKLVVEVHSDQPRRDKSDRQAWTEARATAIRQALLDQGLAPERVEAVGLGVTKPLVPATARDAAKNRRVEFNLAPMPTKKVVPLAPTTTASLPTATTPAVTTPAPATTTPAPAAKPAEKPADNGDFSALLPE